MRPLCSGTTHAPRHGQPVCASAGVRGGGRLSTHQQQENSLMRLFGPSSLLHDAPGNGSQSPQAAHPPMLRCSVPIGNSARWRLSSASQLHAVLLRHPKHGAYFPSFQKFLALLLPASILPRITYFLMALTVSPRRSHLCLLHIRTGVTTVHPGFLHSYL